VGNQSCGTVYQWRRQNAPQIQFFSDVVRLINCYIIIIINVESGGARRAHSQNQAEIT